MKDTINNMLSKANLRLLKHDTFNKVMTEKDFYENMALLHSRVEYKSEENLEIFIFSMDRAMQLYTLITSIQEYLDKKVRIQVLYRGRTEEHNTAYQEVIELFKSHEEINFVRQFDKTDFRPKFISMLETVKTQSLFFLVDDIVFKDQIKVTDLTKFNPLTHMVSLRLGTHLKWIYTRKKDQKLPPFKQEMVDSDKCVWIWGEGEHDWGYPLSVDGNIFSTEEILLLTKFTNFNTPNSYEANMQPLERFFMKRYGVAYKSSKIINLPINRVNDDTSNHFGNIDENFLLKKWQEGYMIDYKKFFQVMNISAHQELEVAFVKR